MKLNGLPDICSCPMLQMKQMNPKVPAAAVGAQVLKILQFLAIRGYPEVECNENYYTRKIPVVQIRNIFPSPGGRISPSYMLQWM
jgi:hypothetical protein